MKNIAIILFITILFGCQNDRDTAEQGKESSETPAIDNIVRLTSEQLENASIDSVSLEKVNISGVLRLNGTVEVDPDNRVSLSSALGGHIKSVNVLPGQAVRKGEAILTIEDNQFIQVQQDYLTTKAELTSAEADFNRQKELNASKSVSDKAVEQAETEYLSLLATKRGLEEKLRLINISPSQLTPANIRRGINIVAPFNGVISDVMVNKGKYVSPSDVLVELINPQSMLLRLQVFEKDWSSVRVGQTIEAHTNQESDKKIQAEIISTGMIINEDGSALVIARVKNPQIVPLVPGLYVNALIHIENKNVYTLPNDAIVSFENKSYIFEWIESTSFRMKEITTGSSNDGKVEIVNYEDLVGKPIVNKGAYSLLMAAKNKSEEE